MNKQEFLARLKNGLSGLPQEDVEERLSFYGEMIEDRIEEGLTEEDAIAEIGTVDEVIAQIVAQTPLTKIVREKVRPKRRLRAWEIILLVLGSPIWLSLSIAAAAILLSVYIVLWALIIVLWAIEIAFAASALACAAASVVPAVHGSVSMGLASLGAALFLAGLSIFLFFGCKAATKGVLLLTKKIALGVKSLFIGKGGNNEQNS